MPTNDETGCVCAACGHEQPTMDPCAKCRSVRVVLDVKPKRWIHKDVARRRHVAEDIVRRIYIAVQIAKRQGLHGGYTVDLIERSVSRNLTVYESNVAHLAREHLGYSSPPCGYGGPKPRGSAKEPSHAIDQVKVNEAMRLVSEGDAIITDVLKRRKRSTRSRKPSFSMLLNKAANILNVAARTCARAGATIRAGTLRERAKYAQCANFDMLALYDHYNVFQEDPVTKRATKRHVDQKAADYRPTRGKIDDPLRSGASSILRAVDKGGGIALETLTELLELLRTKTDYHFHIEVAILPTGSAIMKTIDNERDAKETIRRLKEKKP